MNQVISLNIIPDLERDNKRITRVMADWSREPLEVLLKEYKKHSILYDMRNPKYYNRTQRQKALNNIIDVLEPYRPGTTPDDIVKKIQKIRTQFGQEQTKVRRAEARGLLFRPTVWWYPFISFLQHHIRKRDLGDDSRDEADPGTVSESQISEGDYENYAEETYEFEDEDQQIVYEIQSTPSGKVDTENETKLLLKQTDPPSTPVIRNRPGQITYKIIGSNELMQKRKLESLTPPPQPQPQKTPRLQESVIEERTVSPILAESNDAETPVSSPKKSANVTETHEVTVDSDRCRSLGNFVASQIASIKDDYLFYSTQMDVLNIINKAQLKQLQMDKEANK